MQRKKQTRKLFSSKDVWDPINTGYMQLIDFIQDPTFAINSRGEIIAWNDSMEALTGITKETMLGKGDYEYALPFYGQRRPVLVDLALNPDPEIEKNYAFMNRESGEITAEAHMVMNTDRESMFLLRARPLLDKDGNIFGAIESIRDVSEQKYIRDTLMETENRYTALFDRSLECIYIQDLEGNFIDVNQTAQNLLGYSREEFLSLDLISLITDDQLPQAIRDQKEIIKNGHQNGTSTYKVQRKDGDFVYLESKGVLIYRDNKPYAIQGVARDITQRKKIEEALIQSERKYRNIFENVTDFLYVHDMEGNLLETNLASKMDLGYTAEDVSWMNITDLMPDQYKPLFKDYMEDLKKHGTQEGLISILTKEGRERVIEYKNILVCDSAGNPVCAQGSGRDITERLKAEKALKISEEKYRNILDSIEEPYFEVDLNGNFTFFNQALGRNLGYTDEKLMGMNYKQYMDEANAKKVFEMFHSVYLTREPTKSFDWVLMDKNGRRLYAETSVSLMRDSKNNPVGFRGIVRDITERKEAEKERDRYEMRLFQAQKMEAIGTLTGGIAHDFNNILSAIIGYTELAKNEVNEGSRTYLNLDQVLKAGMRARELVAKILSLSRKFEAEREPVKVGLILRETLDLLHATIPTSIQIRDNIDQDSGFVFADPTEIHQIIMNLCTNAFQAMEDTGGVLSVNMVPVENDQDNLIFTGDMPLKKGTYLRLSVADTGCGMSEETTKHIFDPFFTTKEKGKGTGLGLATIHRIVSDLKGQISVESEQGRGTTFTIYFPCCSASNAKQIDA